MFVPGRSADPCDLLADTLGARHGGGTAAGVGYNPTTTRVA